MAPRRSLQATVTAGAPSGCRASSEKKGERSLLREIDSDLTQFTDAFRVRTTVATDARSPVTIDDGGTSESERAVDPPL